MTVWVFKKEGEKEKTSMISCFFDNLSQSTQSHRVFSGIFDRKILKNLISCHQG
uniref:Uncharacterized protein n=1 Tax=uncultured Desulfobacterium sp. TaxID=201089 RepID=E1YJT8_9BACT|nr:unknown protein [uncultured Desulfobacterium sp.]